MLQRLGLALLLLALSFLAACSTTAPRFRSSDEESGSADAEWDSPADSIALREVIAREDDRKVDLTTEANYLAHSHRTVTDDTPPGLSRDKLLLDIVSFLKVPYRYGGSTRDGIDCSAFTSLMYASAVGLSLPRSASEQYRVGSRVTKSELRFGDLVFFRTLGRRVSHVGIFLENDIFAHASVSEGVTFSSLESKYYKQRYVGARRIVH
ncbi:MAG: C40 family peptidase [Bacteroidota bacterium]